jgi:non-ribosomal peptide synthetase component E (peptide arylation enzyme)
VWRQGLEVVMSEQTCWESVKGEGGQILDKVKQIVREGNVRRVRVKQGERTIAEFPLTVGVVGAVFAPMLAAVGAIVALAADCSIEIERFAQAEPPVPPAPQETTQPPVM